MTTNNFSASVSLNTGNSNKSIRALYDNVQKLSKGLDDLNKSIQDSNGNMDSLAESFRQTADASREAMQASQDLTAQRKQENDAAGESAQAEKTRADAYGKSATAAKESGQASEAAADGSKKAADGARDFGGAQDGLTTSTRRSQDATNAYSESLASHRYLMYDVGDTYRTLSVALLAIPAATSAAAIAYEKDFAQVQRTTGLAGEAAENYQGQLRALATEIPTTFAELSEVSKIGGQMGVAEESLESFTDTVIRFTETSQGVNIDSAATAFGRLENMFNVTPTGELADPAFFERIGSAISYTGDNSVATEAKIIAMLDKTTASAKNAGLEVQETIALSSAMVSSGLQPFLSSGFIIRFFGNFQKAAAAGGSELEELSRTLGLTSQEFQNLVRNDPYELLHRVVTQMKDMDSVQGQQFLTKLGINGVQDPKVLNALSENLHVLDAAMEDVNTSYAGADYLNKSSADIFDTTAAKIQKAVNAFMNLGSTIGQSTLPVFGALLTSATDLVSGLDAVINSSDATRVAFGLLMGAITVAGGLAAFRSILAFTNAGLVMFRDAAQKGALAGGHFGGIGKQLAQIGLLHKGATDQQVQSMMKGRSTSESLRIAFAAQRTELQRLSGVRKADIGAISAHNAAIGRGNAYRGASLSIMQGANNSTRVHTTLTNASATAYANAATKGGMWNTVMAGTKSLVGTFLNPATLAIGAIIGIGTAWSSASSEANQFTEALSKTLDGIGNMEGAYDAAMTAMTERTMDWKDSLFRGVDLSLIGDDMLTIFNQAGVTGEQLAAAAEKGADGYRELSERIKEANGAQITMANAAASPIEKWARQILGLNDEIGTSSSVAVQELEALANQADTTADAEKRLAENGAEAADGTALLGDEALDASQDVQSFGQSIDDALNTVFGFINAEAGMTTALDNMGKSLHESTDMSAATTEGIQNIQNYQSTVSAAMRMMEQELADGTFSTVQEATAYYTQFFEGLEQQLLNAGVDPAQAQQMTQMALEAMQATLGSAEGGLVAELGLDPTPAYSELAATGADMQAIVEEVPFEFHLDADGQPATETTWAVVNWIAEAMGITPNAVLDAVDGTATENTQRVWEYIMAAMHDDYIAYLNADASGGTEAVASFHNWASDRLAEISSGISNVVTSLSNVINDYNNVAIGTGLGGVISGLSSSGPIQGGIGKIVAPRISSFRQNAPSAPAPAKPSMATPNIPKPDFSALNRGYNDAAKAARGAGNAGRNAGKKAADGARGAGKAAKGAGNAAKGAGAAAKKAGEDGATAAEKAAQAARDWNKAYQDVQSYAGRVGEALQMAFDQKHAVQSAKDQYYTILNSINDRLKQQKDRLRELREETSRLNAERRVELNEASKFERMAEVAAFHGNDERAQDYRDQAKAMRERAKEMSSSISANKAEASSIKAGIGNLKGYSQAAIDNREELRRLEQAALKVPEAYASIGASSSRVAAETRKWTSLMQSHAREMGYTDAQVRDNTVSTSNYIRELNRVPRRIPTDVKASHSGVGGVNKALDNAARPRTAPITAQPRGISSAAKPLNSVSAPRTSPMVADARNVRPTDKILGGLAMGLKAAGREAPITAHSYGTAITSKNLDNVATGRGGAAFGAGGRIADMNARARNVNPTVRTLDGVAGGGFGAGGRIAYMNARERNTRSVSGALNTLASGGRSSSGRIADMNARARNTRDANRDLNRVASGRTATINARTGRTSGVSLALSRLTRTRYVSIVPRVARAGAASGAIGSLRFNSGGPVPGFNSGGMIPGQSPSNPKEDNLMASVDNRGLIAVRSGEYIQPQPAVDYYGQDFMEKVRKMQLPKYWAGGSIGGSSSSADAGPVELSAKTINALAQRISQTTVLEVSREELARSVSEGQRVNNQLRGNFKVV